MKKWSEFLSLRERCWPGYKSVPGKKAYSPGSCMKESAAAAVAAAIAISKKKSGNYDKEGFRKTAYKNPDSPNRKSNTEREAELKEDLRKWFSKTDPGGDWKRINSKGEAIGPCAREPGEPKPKCMSRAKRESLTKKERASAVAAKRKHDPDPERQGKPINVSNFGKGKISENMENLDEKNVPTNPSLWSQAKSLARSKFDVYPSAYANGWASKWYKGKGGSWKSVSEAKEESEYDYEGDMARGQLQSIINNAQRVHDMLKDKDNLPEWVQSKITLAEDYISTVANYMMSEVDEEVMQEGIQDEPHEIVHKETGKTVSTHKNFKGAYSAYQNLVKASDHAIGHIPKKTNEAVSHEPWKDKTFGPTKVIQQKYKVKTDTKTYNVKAETEAHAHKLVSNHAPGSKIVSIEHKGRIMEEVEPITELSSDALDRYKAKAKKSADDLTSQGKYRQANDRTMNVMKATGKQIDKTATNIRKALNRESVDQDMAEDDVADFLARGGKITQVKPNRGPRNPGLSLGSRHIGGGGDGARASRTGRGSRPQGKPVVAVESVTKEDIITKLKAKLGDYLSDIGQEIRKDPDLINKLAATPAGNQMGPPVKTVTTDDGHEISIHGNEDDGFRISIKNRQTPSQFSNLDEAVMACEMYCARRRQQAVNADYVEEA